MIASPNLNLPLYPVRKIGEAQPFQWRHYGSCHSLLPSFFQNTHTSGFPNPKDTPSQDVFSLVNPHSHQAQFSLSYKFPPSRLHEFPDALLRLSRPLSPRQSTQIAPSRLCPPQRFPRNERPSPSPLQLPPFHGLQKIFLFRSRTQAVSLVGQPSSGGRSTEAERNWGGGGSCGPQTTLFGVRHLAPLPRPVRCLLGSLVWAQFAGGRRMSPRTTFPIKHCGIYRQRLMGKGSWDVIVTLLRQRSA